MSDPIINNTNPTEDSSNITDISKVTVRPVISGTYTVECCGDKWDLNRNLLLDRHPQLPTCTTCSKQVVYVKTCNGKTVQDNGDTVKCRHKFFQPNGSHNHYCRPCQQSYFADKNSKNVSTTLTAE